MKKNMFSVVLLALLNTLFFPFLVYASSVTIFNAKQYDKEKGKPVIYTDVFPARSSGTYTLEVWQGENGVNMAKNGNITLNGVEVVSSGELRKSTGYIAKVVSLQLDNTLLVKLKGKSGVFLKVKVTGTGGDLPNITFSSPLDGAIINEENIMITGTFFSPLPEISVKVNGKLAEVNGNEFFVNRVPLNLGENSIIATLSEEGGFSTEEIITIKADYQLQPVKLTSNLTSGTLPLIVNFDIDTNLSNSIVSYQMDFDGDGSIDYTADNSDNIFFTYNASGIYYATATVTDDLGNQYSELLAINVLSLEEFNALLTSKWNGAMDSLKNKDIQTALSYFAENKRAKYEEAFLLIADQLPSIFSSSSSL